jgi:hypothetical protein
MCSVREGKEEDVVEVWEQEDDEAEREGIVADDRRRTGPHKAPNEGTAMTTTTKRPGLAGGGKITRKPQSRGSRILKSCSSESSHGSNSNNSRKERCLEFVFDASKHRVL